MMQARAEARDNVDADMQRWMREAARQNGTSVAEWMESVVLAHASKAGIDAGTLDPEQKREIIAAQLARLSTAGGRDPDWSTLQNRSEKLNATTSRRQWRDSGHDIDAEPTPGRPDARKQDAKFPLPSRQDLDSMAEAELDATAAERERQLRERSAKTAEALANATQWIRKNGSNSSSERTPLDTIADRLSRIEDHVTTSDAAASREPLLQLQNRMRDLARGYGDKAIPPVHAGALHELGDQLTKITDGIEEAERSGASHAQSEIKLDLTSRLPELLASFERQIAASPSASTTSASTTSASSQPAAAQSAPAALGAASLSAARAKPTSPPRRAGFDRRTASLSSINTAVAEITRHQRDLEQVHASTERTPPRDRAEQSNVAARQSAGAPQFAGGHTAAEVLQFEQRLEDIARRIERATARVEPNAPASPEVDGVNRDTAPAARAVAAQSDARPDAAGRTSDTNLPSHSEPGQPARPESAGPSQIAAVEAVQTPELHTQVARLRQDLADISNVLAEVLPRTSVAALESAVHDLSVRIQGMRDEGAREALLAPIEELAAEVRSALGRVDGRDTVEAIDKQMRQIGEKLDLMSRQELDPATITRIHEQTRDIRDLLSAAASRPMPFEQIEGRINALGERLDQVAKEMARRPPSSDLPSRSDDIRALLQDMAPAAAVAALEGRFETLAAKIDEVLAKAQPNGAIEALSDKVERIQQTLQTSGDTGALEALVRRLAENVEQMQSKELDHHAVEALEAQIGTIVARLDKSDASFAALGALEHTVGDLFGKLEETRLAAEDAARNAAREAWSGSAAGTMTPNTDAIGRELTDLRALHDASDRRIHTTMSVVQETLERVVARLAALDDEQLGHGARPVRAQEHQTNSHQTHQQQPHQSADAHGVAHPPLVRPASAAPAPAASAPKGGVAAAAAKPAGAEIASDFLIEPGAALPSRRPDDKLRDVAAGAAASTTTEPVEAPSASFIAAARRAAQAAAAESAGRRPRGPADDAGRDPLAGSGAGADQIKAFIAAKKRPILLALAGLVIALGAYAVVRTVTQPNTAVVPAGLPTPTVEPKKSEPGTRSDAATPNDARAAADATSTASGNRSATLSGPVDATPTASLPPASRRVLPLRESAQRGDAAAQFEMGVRLSEGRLMPRDLAAAAQWFEKSAEQGLAPSQYRLGALYEKGTGVPQDLTLALAWYQRAATAGNARAMHNLAVITAEGGTNGKPNYATAVSWFRQAAELGVRDSQYNLAILTARGLGTAQDLTESYMWFSLAAQQGDTDAAKKRDEVAKQLDAQALAGAQAKAEAFKILKPNRAANVVEAPPGGWDPAPRLQRGVQMPRANVSSL